MRILELDAGLMYLSDARDKGGGMQNAKHGERICPSTEQNLEFSKIIRSPSSVKWNVY
jgi:hypothetical protein